MKKTILTLAISSVALLSSCSVTVPVTATSNEIGNKVGEAKTTQILGFFFDGGDAGIQKAAKNGGIKRVSTVDFKQSVGFLGIWTTYKTIVTGD